MHNRIVTLTAEIDRSHALLLSEPQILIAWAAAADEAEIVGDATIVAAAGTTQRVLAFGTWLDAEQAQAMERAVEALRSRGESFAMPLNPIDGRPVEAEGRAVGGRAILRLRDVSGIRQELAALAARHRDLLEDVDSLRTLINAIPSPLWARDQSGSLVFVNAAYVNAVEAKDAADAIERRLELLDRAAREESAHARRAGTIYRNRLPAIVAGTRRTFDVIDIPTRRGSAGAAFDATESEQMRLELARIVDAHRRTLDQLATGVAIFAADQRLSFYNAAYRALWDLDAGFLDQGPTDGAVLEKLRAARKLPEQQDFRQWKSQFHEAYRALEAKEHEWYLPDGRTLRVVTTPNPEGGVTYLFDDVTERLDLERRYDSLIRVQGETLDNLNEAVAVFASDGRLRLLQSGLLAHVEAERRGACRTAAYRGGDRLVRAVASRGHDVAGAARDGDGDRGPRAGHRPPGTPRRQHRRLRHNAAARRRDARHLPGRLRHGQCRARAARTQRRAGGRRSDQDRLRTPRLLRAALAADQHHRLRAFPQRSGDRPADGKASANISATSPSRPTRCLPSSTTSSISPPSTPA